MPNEIPSPYTSLEHTFAGIGKLKEVQAIAHWDEACMMPSGGGAGRGEALATLTSLIHAQSTHPSIGEEINKAEAQNDLSTWQVANLREMKRTWIEATAVPADLIHAQALATSVCEQTWRKARSANDWPAVAGLLGEVVNLSRQHAQALGSAMDLAPYDALLETYESDLRTSYVTPLFEDLKAYLPTLLDKVLGVQSAPLPLTGPFPTTDQSLLCSDAMQLLGFDFDRGRFDVSHHPFCGGVPDDTRITTRYENNSFLESFMAICHETGHALYQQGLPVDWRNQPVGYALGAAIHESQSLLMELQVCRSRPFVDHIAPDMRARFGRSETDPAWQSENLYRHATLVERGYIRVDADEVTYPLHVILRYEIEVQLINGTLSVEDIPEAWNDAMQRYLGLTTLGNFADGCMQDVHWFAGLFGYFPTYTLGALGAAQWFATALDQEPGINGGIAAGEASAGLAAD